MSDTEYFPKSFNIFKLLFQWGVLPSLSLCLGIIGTYHSQVQSIRDSQMSVTKDAVKIAEDLKTEREDRKSNDELINSMLQTVIKLDTEVITLFRVQQQAKAP